MCMLLSRGFFVPIIYLYRPIKRKKKWKLLWLFVGVIDDVTKLNFSINFKMQYGLIEALHSKTGLAFPQHFYAESNYEIN